MCSQGLNNFMQLLQSLFNITFDALIYDVANCWEKHFDWLKLIERRNYLCFTLILTESCRQQQPQLSVPAGLCPGLKATLPKAAHRDKAATLLEHPQARCKLTNVDDLFPQCKWLFATVRQGSLQQQTAGCWYAALGVKCAKLWNTDAEIWQRATANVFEGEKTTCITFVKTLPYCFNLIFFSLLWWLLSSHLYI